jgi:HD superfamily phosphohydrolase
LVYKNIIPNPIHGTIDIPDWLLRIINEKAVRRMLFIRQLGLKAYIDYPGAIHTRYSHVLGVMHLAGRIIDMLSEFERNKGRKETAASLSNNKINVMAAGFFHDIGHGPFSHVIDYILDRYGQTTHENRVFEIMKKFDDIENDGITINKVKEIILGHHPYPFVNHVVNGPLESDKLDYLLRDAHHVGLRCSLDLDHFITNFRILGTDSSQLRHCELGLEDNTEALATAEIFIVIWKNMYELVYHITNSRIAEKMLEKSIILRSENDYDFRSYFTDMDKFIELHDEKLFEILKDGSGLSAHLISGIRDNNLYLEKYNKELPLGDKTNLSFIEQLNKAPEYAADKLSQKLSEISKCDKYEIICDIVKSRIPKTIHTNNTEKDSGDPIELRSRSNIIDSIREKSRIKVYAKKDLDLSTEIDENLVNKIIGETNWGD